jgi:hypothetical protein
MKKISFIILAVFLLSGMLQAQVKTNFTLQNGRIESGKFVIDLYSTVPAGQTWNVGPTCVRMSYWTTDPANAISLITENPVTNANTNLSANTNYSAMKTTSILNGSAVSLNIFLFNSKPAYALTAGSYWIGSLYFNIVTPGSCINMSFYEGSAVFDDANGLAYGTGWTKIDPPPCIISGLNQVSTEVPSQFKLEQNYPNPFNPVTKINFAIAKAGFVSVKVYDVLGKVVATLVNENKREGVYIVDFDASALHSGVYFYKMETNGFVSVKRMIVVK